MNGSRLATSAGGHASNLIGHSVSGIVVLIIIAALIGHIIIGAVVLIVTLWVIRSIVRTLTVLITRR